MLDCPACHARYKRAISCYCSHCGMERLNLSEGQSVPADQCVHSGVGGHDRYCDLCGSMTKYGKEIARCLGQLSE